MQEQKCNCEVNKLLLEAAKWMFHIAIPTGPLLPDEALKKGLERALKAIQKAEGK